MTEDARPKRGHSFADLAQALGLNLSGGGERLQQAPAANDSSYAPVSGADFFRVCRDTERTAHLTRLAGYALAKGMDLAGTTALCLGWNARNDPPLDDPKVTTTVASIAATHQRNHPLDQDPDTPLFDLEDARVDRFLDCDPPPREWVLIDCLPLGKVGLLVAPGGTGKSQLALQLAVAVATGTGLAGWWAVGEKGPALALFAEEDEDELHRRLRAILRARSSSPDYEAFVADLRENLYLKSMTGADNLMTKAEAGGSVTRTDIAERLCATVATVPNVKLVIIDPVSRFRGGNENYAEDATRFVEAAELIAQTIRATVLLVHHANKASRSAEEQNQAASRGSSALTDGVRWQMNLAPLSDEQAEKLGLEPGSKHEFLSAKVTKNNYAPSGEAVNLRRGDAGVLIYHDATHAQSATDTDRMRLLIQLVRDNAVKQMMVSKTKFAKHYGDPKGVFKMGMNKLDALIGKALAEGYLTQGPLPQRYLIATDKQVGIAKAKVPTASHAHDGT